jgi:hypothetical protein
VIIMRFGIALAGLILSVSATRVDAACAVTVREAVRSGKPYETFKTRELAPVPFDFVVASADVIVEGIVQPIGTFVSDDGCYIFTAYVVTPPNLIAGRLPSSSQPGPSLVVRQWGGETVVDGVKVVFRDHELPPMIAGQHVILFLTSTQSPGVYNIAGGPAGVFSVKQGRAKAWTTQAEVIHGERADVPVSDFVADVKRLKRP